ALRSTGSTTLTGPPSRVERLPCAMPLRLPCRVVKSTIECLLARTADRYHGRCPEDSSAILPPGRGGRYDPTMQRSDTRVLTTHAGSLPRPPPLGDMYVRVSLREPVDAAALAAAAEGSSRRTVRQQ